MAFVYGLSNRGRYLILKWAFPRTAARPDLFYLGLVTKQNEHALNAAAAVNEGGGLVGIPVTSHGYAVGSVISIEGTVNYNGLYLVNAATTTHVVVIEATYVAETFSGSELIHRAPSPSDNVLSDLSEIVAGNGYPVGGVAVSPDSVDWDTMIQDDAVNRAYTRMSNQVIAASGGAIPPSGDGARYAVLLDDNALPASRQHIASWPLGTDSFIPDTESMSLIDFEIFLADNV